MQTIDGLSHWLAQRLPLAAQIALSAALVDDARPLYREAGRRLVSRLEADDERAPPLDRLARDARSRPGQLAALVADMLGTREFWLPKLFGEADRHACARRSTSFSRPALESELARLRRAARRSRLAVPVRGRARRRPRRAARRPARVVSRCLPAGRRHSADAVDDWRALRGPPAHGEQGRRAAQEGGAGQGFLPATDGTEWRALKRRMKEELESLAAHDGVAAPSRACAACRRRG